MRCRWSEALVWNCQDVHLGHALGVHAFGLCGPAASAVDIARSRPFDFIRFAAELLRTGTGQIGTFSVSPGTQVRNYRVVNSKTIPEADFLVLASLRDSDMVLDANTKVAEYAGVGQWELFDWCVKCGYPRVVMY